MIATGAAGAKASPAQESKADAVLTVMERSSDMSAIGTHALGCWLVLLGATGVPSAVLANKQLNLIGILR